MIEVTIEEIKDYQATHHCGVHQARNEVMRSKMVELLLNAPSAEDFAPILFEIITRMQFKDS